MGLPRRASHGGLRPRLDSRQDVATLALALLASLALAASGCAPAAVSTPPKSGAAPAASAKPRPRPGYDRRSDALGSVDTSSLHGRHIVLDPGHGGFFRGALGVHGLTEAEVNLGVALALRGLLEARGAEVLMTRTDDRDFLTPTDSTLRSDLAERTRIANAFAPDLFVSIHHNADARGAHDVNETQTYYKLGDEGPSLDAAQSVHRFLVRNLGIDANRLMPGNYFVLRNSDAPAILTESSYITNPDVESKLGLESKQRLEAEALYLGLAHYFSRPRPVVAEFVARASEGAAPDTLFMQLDAPVLTARVTGAFDAAELTIDGTPVGLVRAGDRLIARPGPLAAGTHVATLDVRMAGSGTARERTARFTLRRSAARLRAALEGPPAGPEGGLVGVRVDVTDAFGLAFPDSTAIRLSTRDAGVAPRDTLVVARDGVAFGYFRVGAVGAKSAPRISASLAGNARSGTAVTAAPVALAASRRAEWRTAFARRMPGDSALVDAPGTREPREPGAWINRDGFVALPVDSAGRPIVPGLGGYRPWASESPWPPRFARIAGGALQGRRIVLDPDGGGDADGGTGPSGTRAANVNLDVARALAGFLTVAGAEVQLTRNGDFALSDVERVQISEAFHADRFLRIGHRAEPPMLGYWFSSAAGKRWADGTALALASVGFTAPKAAEDAQYPLQQTSCPALYVSVARIDVAAAEERLARAHAIRNEAYALYLGLAREWADASHWMPDSIVVRDSGGRPLPGASVVLGGGFVLLTDERGIARYVRTEPGPLDVEIVHPRVHAHRVLLDSMVGETVTGSGRH